MADVAALRQAKPAQIQLPVSWYFDPEIFALEKKLLFDATSPAAKTSSGRTRLLPSSVA